MRTGLAFLFCGVAFAATQLVLAERGTMSLPKTVEAGTGFSIQSTGTGKAALYIVGPGQALKRDMNLGETISFPEGSLLNAGHYVAILASQSFTENYSFDVVPANKPSELSFLAKPSRLQVGLHGGITGAVYIFDAYHNLIAAPMAVTFELSSPSGAVQRRTVITREGVAWTGMDSTTQQGIDKFVARVGDISSARVVAQVPGDPCGLKISARQTSQRLLLATEPVRDCNGNAVPDGTIVTFTETYNGDQSMVDVPLKHGIAEVQMPAHAGATISVASGVVLGNQIHWEK